MRGVRCIVALVLVGAFAPAARAQIPQTRADSLEARLRALRAKLDSLARVVADLRHGGKDTTAAQDDLAALRAAAAAAAGVADTAPPAAPTQFVDQSRSQPKLNPEISATGDVRVQTTRDAWGRHNVDVREFELAFQSPLDPFSDTKIFLTFGRGEVGVEEGYAYWTGLPGHLRLDLGRFREQFGELNRWHAHELPQSEYPLAIREYLGEDGLAGDGVSLYWLAPVGGGAAGTHEFWGQTTLADNPTLFADGNRLAVLGHVNNFWSLSPATFVQIGGSAIYGENPDSILASTVLGVDFRLNWRPPREGQYRSFVLRGEGFAATHRRAGVSDTRYGGYVDTRYQLSRRLFLGARVDYVEPFEAPGAHVWGVVSTLTWWQSEWVYLRAEWQHQSALIGGTGRYPLTATGPSYGTAATDRFLIQAVWAIGPHKHETY